MLLLVAKIFVAWWITLMSAIGVWLPIFYVRRSRDDAALLSGTLFPRPKKSPAAASANTRWLLSLANCLSAGMLLTTALMHFFPESFEVAAPAPPASPAVLCSWMLVGILIPAVLERSMKGSGGHSHGVSTDADADHTHGDGGASGSGGAVSTATLLIVLMCFHGMTEGLLLGFENKAAALLSAALPLSIHKFCDGLVIGVAMAKEVFAQVTEDGAGGAAVETEGVAFEKAGRSPQRFWRRLYQGPVGVWLLLTPITMICVVLFASFTKAPVAGAAANVTAVQLSDGTCASGSGGGVSTLAAVQAVGSGSFIYIGLGILHGEELKGTSANVALLCGVALTGSLFLLSSESH